MAKIVEGLFGLTPSQVEQKQAMEQEKRATMLASLAQPGFGQLSYGISNLGYGLGQMAGQLLGVEDPELTKAKDMELIQQELVAELGQEGYADPNKLFPALSDKLMKKGYENEASQALQVGAEEVQKYNTNKVTNQLQMNKLKQSNQELEDEMNFKRDIDKIKAKAALENRDVTEEEILDAALKYSSPDKLLGIVTDKTKAERSLQNSLKVAETNYQNSVRLAEQRQADAKELAKLKQEHQLHLQTIKSSKKDSGKIGANERAVANRVTVSASELRQAANNLNVLTRGGETPVTAGMFRDLEGKGFLSATTKFLGNTLTQDDALQFDAIMRPILYNVGSIQNQGMAVRQFQLANLEKSLLPQAGQSHEAQLTKMGEFRQVVEAGLHGSLTNESLNDDQRALISLVAEQIELAIPFTGQDVLAFTRNNKDPNMTFGQWLDIYGKGRGSFGLATVDGKQLQRPARFTDQMWEKFIQDKGATNVRKYSTTD